MKHLIYLLLFTGLFYGCEQGLTNEAQEERSVEEIAALAYADEEVLKVFELTAAINEGVTEAILGGCKFPDQSGYKILGESTSTRELERLLSEHNYTNAQYLAELYAERNSYLPGFRIRYKPMVDQLTEEEKVQLNDLLPNTESQMSAADAVKKLSKK